MIHRPDGWIKLLLDGAVLFRTETTAVLPPSADYPAIHLFQG